MKAEQLTDSVAYHAEGPVWWPSWGLRFVDMLHGSVLAVAADGTVTRTAVGSRIAAALRPRVGGGAIVAVERGVALARRDDLADLRPLPPMWTDPTVRMNEGGCDPAGRFYVGSMAYDKRRGGAKLYRVGVGHEVATALTGVTISNGIAWSPDGSRAYYNDTRTQQTSVFDWTPQRGLFGRRCFARYARSEGHPDGLCVDAEGGVWVAMNHGGAVRRYDAQGRLSEVVTVPVSQVTACTFGGPDLGTLYLTTSRENLPDGVDVNAGSVWAARPGVAGLPALPYRG